MVTELWSLVSVPLDKEPTLQLQSSSLHDGTNVKDLIGLFWGSEKMMYISQLAQFLAESKHLINISCYH